MSCSYIKSTTTRSRFCPVTFSFALLSLSCLKCVVWLSVGGRISHHFGSMPPMQRSQHFHPVNEEGIYSFKNVCIEHWITRAGEKRPNNTYDCNTGNSSCRIVVYDNTVILILWLRFLYNIFVSVRGIAYDRLWSILLFSYVTQRSQLSDPQQK